MPSPSTDARTDTSLPPIIETAAEHLTRDVPVVAPAATAATVRELLVSRRFESVRDVAVCEDTRLVGLVRIEDVLSAPATTTIGDLMDPDPPLVGHGTDQEVAAWHMVEHGESSLGVVDEDDRFVGLIPPHRMLGVLLREHEEDLARIGGFLHDASAARLASEEPVLRRLAHRLPWLLVGLVGAFLAALLVGSFASTLEENVELAFFLPGIVYLADAVGTQTETLIIRGLSVGVPVRHIVRRELLTGAGVGLVLAAVFLPFAALAWGEWDVAATVALAILFACSTATISGMALPSILTRVGVDPAFGSGPLQTIVQDLASVFIYFGLAVLIL